MNKNGNPIKRPPYNMLKNGGKIKKEDKEMKLAKRNPTSNIYEIGGGKFRGIVGGVPNVTNESDGLVPFDNALIIKDHPIVQYLIKQGPFEIGFHNRNTNKYLSSVRLYTGETLVKTAENDVAVTPIIENNYTIKWLYPNGSWIKEVATEKKIKETMFQKSGQVVKFRYKLNGLTVKKNGNYFDLYRGDQKAFSIQKPYYMTSENGDFDGYVNISWATDGDDWIVTYPAPGVDKYSDPTIVFGEGAGMTGGDHKDSTIAEGTPDQSFSSDTVLYQRNGAGNDLWPIGRFSLLGHVPTNAIINSALLSLYTTVFGGNDNTAIHQLLSPWGITPTDEGASQNPAALGQATYGNAFDRNNPALDTGWAAGVGAGFGPGDFNAVAGSTVLINAVNTWFVWTVTAMCQIWAANDATNYGWALRPSTANLTRYMSQEGLVPANRPFLTVDYTVPAQASITTKQSHIAIYNGIGIM